MNSKIFIYFFVILFSCSNGKQKNAVYYPVATQPKEITHNTHIKKGFLLPGGAFVSKSGETHSESALEGFVILYFREFPKGKGGIFLNEEYGKLGKLAIQKGGNLIVTNELKFAAMYGVESYHNKTYWQLHHPLLVVANPGKRIVKIVQYPMEVDVENTILDIHTITKNYSSEELFSNYFVHFQDVAPSITVPLLSQLYDGYYMNDAGEIHQLRKKGTIFFPDDACRNCKRIHQFYLEDQIENYRKLGDEAFKIDIWQKRSDSIYVCNINILHYKDEQWQPRLKAGDFTIARDTLTDAELADRIKNLIVGLTFK